MGAAGRDCQEFNTAYRSRDDAEVVAFTAAPEQNLGETEQGGHDRYLAELAGKGYPDGIPIHREAELEDLVREQDVDTVVFAYSDVRHETVMHAGSRAIAADTHFEIRGPETAMLDASVPVIAVDAARTGCLKSQVSRALVDELRFRGVEPVVVREPMPQCDLVDGRVRRFETMPDLDEGGVTIEDREEDEQHIERGHVVYAGVDLAT